MCKTKQLLTEVYSGLFRYIKVDVSFSKDSSCKQFAMAENPTPSGSTMELLRGALAEAILSMLIEDIAQRRRLAGLHEKRCGDLRALATISLSKNLLTST